jgi:hypothetical protein
MRESVFWRQPRFVGKEVTGHREEGEMSKGNINSLLLSNPRPLTVLHPSSSPTHLLSFIPP